VEINGNRLNVEVLGDAPDKPTMIAHHGAPGLGSMAEPRRTFAPFADDYRVVVFDARGSGVSEGNGPFTHEQWAADVDTPTGSARWCCGTPPPTTPTRSWRCATRWRPPGWRSTG
jgi:pimeloyl-ACP methyl ester carboxylesterase